MTTIERIQCDCCGALVNNAAMHWEQRTSHFQAKCPLDGINGGMWSMDVCVSCRRKLFDAIDGTVRGIREHAAQERELQDGVRSRKDGW